MRRSKLSQILAGVLVNAIYEMKNYPVVLISTVISPLSLLAVITFVTNGALLGTAIEGGLIMIFFSSGIALQSDLSHLKNDFKLQDMVVSSPTSSRLYMSGMALGRNSLLNSRNRYSYCASRNLPTPFTCSNSDLIHCIIVDVCYFSGFRFHVVHFFKRCGSKLRFFTTSFTIVCYFAARLLSYKLYSHTIQLSCLSLADNLCSRNYAFRNRLP